MNPPVRILLVDDSDDARDISLAALTDGDFDVVDAAAGAEEAYRLLGLDEDPDQEPAYDLILLDIVMPEVDGVEACARIRTSRRYRDVPILMVSGQSDIEVLNQAFVAGAHDYVMKPISHIELLSRVRASLRLKRAIDRRRAREAELRAQAEESGAQASAYGIDAGVGLPNRAAMEAQIRAAAEEEVPTCLVLFTVDSIAGYRQENGPTAAELLLRRVARELASLPAPLGATLGYFGEGQFIVVGVGCDAEGLDQLARAADLRIEQLALPHGSSPYHDHVRVRSSCGRAAGDELLRLPAALIVGAEQALRAKRSHTTITEATL